MANDKKPEGGKAPAKVETINLKVFIHCEGCKKKVRKTLICIEGVHTVEVDGSLGKVTVTGTVDSKVLVKKLEKAGKVAEVLQGGGSKGKDQQKGENKKEGKEEESGGNDKKGKSGGADGNGDAQKKGGNGDDNNQVNSNAGGNGNNGESGKKKKGGGGASVVDGEATSSSAIANKNITPSSVQTGYISMESAEYATHIFSDENANNCHIM